MSVSEIRIPITEGFITADLWMPDPYRGIVIFAHGSGSSRYSPRNQFVARRLNERNFATLLIDLLMSEEEAIDRHTAEYRFDIALLSRRVVAAIRWIRSQQRFLAVPLGCYGASTGAAAALVAAAEQPEDVAAIVSRGGRVDLARDALPRVLCPVLLIVGENDSVVLDLNRSVLNTVGAAVKKLVIIPGASHLFEEEGALEQVADYTVQWFEQYLGASQWELS